MRLYGKWMIRFRHEFLYKKHFDLIGNGGTIRAIGGCLWLKKINIFFVPYLTQADLLLIHEPTGDVHEIYRAMETAYKDGKLRAIGISNFLEERYLDLVNHCKVIPAVNQVETHVFRQQKKLRQLECQIGTKHESWSPLACGQNGIFKNHTLLGIAQNHGKSVAQVALRFLLQQGIVVIPKTTHTPRMKENFAALDFDLEADEMLEIEQLEIGKSLFGWW